MYLYFLLFTALFCASAATLSPRPFFEDVGQLVAQQLVGQFDLESIRLDLGVGPLHLE